MKMSTSSSSVTYVAVVALLLVGLAGYSLLNPAPNASTTAAVTCDSALSSALGITNAGLCLQNVQISVSQSNSSQFIVPVMIMGQGTTTTMDILYLLDSESVGHSGPIQNVTTDDFPVAISVPSGQASTQVTFSNASVLYAGKGIIIYSYTLTASVGSAGYYAIAPPFYFGAYPVLTVGTEPGELNGTALSMWGYDGMMQSGEFALPSDIVGTGTLTLVNSTVPATPTCPNPACVVVAHSGD